MYRSHLTLPLALVLGACGGGSITGESDGGPGDGPPSFEIPGLTAITVTPANPTVTIEQDTAPELTFTATGMFIDGHSEDISTRVAWTVEKPGLGFMTGAKFTGFTAFGGRTLITARAGLIIGQTQLMVILHKEVNDPAATDLPADPGGKFDGPLDGARNPELVYPSNGVLLPPNLAKLEMHFKPGTNNTLFDIHFTNELTDVHIYTRCVEPVNGGCVFKFQPAFWLFVAETNRGGAPLHVEVRGTQDDGSAHGVSAQTDVSFSQDTIRGAIYYWGIRNGNDSAIYRFDFAEDQEVAERFVDGDSAGQPCIGCHALSRDGDKLVAEVNGQNDGRLLLWDVPGDQALLPFASGQESIFESWNPEATHYVGVCGDDGCADPKDFNLLVIDATTGQKVESIDIGGTAKTNGADHPDWSPDGNKIVFTRTGANTSTMQRMHQGAIQMVTRTGGTWGAPTTLVAYTGGENHYYPAFSPDSQIVAFDISTCPGGDNAHKDCNADSDPSAEIHTVLPDGTKRVRLANLNNPAPIDNGDPTLTNSFPKWCPFEFQRTGELGSRLMWITFSSTRKFGLKDPPGDSNEEGEHGTFIWMAAIDPDAALRGEDSSSPPFVLPFQELDGMSSNHIAQWTEKVSIPIP